MKASQLGIVLGADGMLRFAPGLERIPDVSFISYEKLPDRRLPRDPIASLIPDLAVEVISSGNTAGEMERKLHEYFALGVRLVWYVYPKTREVYAFTQPNAHAIVGENGLLDGADVLPGLQLAVREIFAE